MNDEKKVIKSDDAARGKARDLRVDVLNRNRVCTSLRTAARLVRLGLEELNAAQKLVLEEIGDERLMSKILHYQNQLTLAELDMPDLGAMERQIEHLRLQAFIHPAEVARGQRSEDRGQTEKITGELGDKVRSFEHGANARRSLKGVAA